MKKIIVIILLSLHGFASYAKEKQFFFTTSDNIQLYVRIAGEGKPCLFVHGGPGSTSAYFEQTGAAPALEEKMQMIYFDQRGSGRSKGDYNDDYSLQRMLLDMEELRESLNIKQWVIMGHSFGGLLITNYAYYYPASVQALIMVNGTLNIPYSLQSHINFGIEELKLTDKKYTDTSLPAMHRLQAVHNKLTEAGVWYKLMFRNAFEKRWSDSTTNAIGNFNRAFADKIWDNKEYNENFAPLTTEIKVPALVITGTKDFAIGISHYRSFNYQKQTVVYYYGGHCPYQEEPQWFSEKILAFLSNQ
jgi:proline iminopeptidase